jgi:threonine dehydratase
MEFTRLPHSIKCKNDDGKILAEITSCQVIAAAMQGKLKFKPEEKVVFLLSGGNIGMDQFKKFEEVTL